MKYGKRTFAELEHINANGFEFEGIQHQIDLVSCCDWKAAACIEGNVNVSFAFSVILHIHVCLAWLN